MKDRNIIIVHQTYHIVTFVLLYIALTGTSWEIIEYEKDEKNIISTVEYGLWKVCQNSKTGKICNEISPVSDELMTARVFMVIAVIAVILHMVYTFTMYVLKYGYNKKKDYKFISVILLLLCCLGCCIALIVKSLDDVNEVLFHSLSRKVGFSFGITISTCASSLLAVLVTVFL